MLISVAAIVLGSLFAFNPIVSEQPLHGNVLFNSLLLAYLAPAGLALAHRPQLSRLFNLDRLRPLVEGLGRGPCDGLCLA